MYQRNIRRKWTIVLAVFAFTFVMQQAFAQHTTHNDSVAATVSDTIDNDSAMAVIDADLNAMDPYVSPLFVSRRWWSPQDAKTEIY